MALFSLSLQSSRKKDKREEEVTPIDKPTFIEQLTGTGDFMRELGSQKKALTSEYLKERRNYRDDRRLRRKEYKKEYEKRREDFWGRRAGRWDLVNNPSHEEQVDKLLRSSNVRQIGSSLVNKDITSKDKSLRRLAEKYNDMEERSLELFIKSERQGEKQIEKGFHERLGQASSQLRARTKMPRQSPGGGFTHISPRNRPSVSSGSRGAA